MIFAGGSSVDSDHWAAQQSTAGYDTGLGVHVFDLPTESIAAGGTVEFTFRWLETGSWEGANFVVLIVEDEADTFS